ncbi:hypothetical protein FNJ62_05465 [Streptomyces benahoarensis]|uniref:Uncharacterized protein n=1 Tax=Streptomyces benahoarensis TaxID=2595054 RepID=A0A553ZQ60_9ACTN|nr:hypothetical protein FNJ62_05465 [Streptomyces benahoarensis]TSB43563.1 hypothetical protein FNZ23_03735 [Streptomyces benahoarensis]
MAPPPPSWPQGRPRTPGSRSALPERRPGPVPPFRTVRRPPPHRALRRSRPAPRPIGFGAPCTFG